MTSRFSFNKDGIYHDNPYTPSLLELQDIKCGDFKEKFKILIDDLEKDINNINNPQAKMLYDTGVHINNAREVVRAMVACFECIHKKIMNDEYVKDCIEDNNPTDDDENEDDESKDNEEGGEIEETFSMSGSPSRSRSPSISSMTSTE